MYLSELSVETEIKILYNIRVYTYSEGGINHFLLPPPILTLVA